MNQIFFFFLSILGIQRISELLYARKNEKTLRAKGAVEYDRAGYSVIVTMHVLFFLSLVAEKIYLGRTYNSMSLLFLILFVFAQLLRYWAISSLGVFWNTRIIVLPGNELVNRGPYKYLRHPNYISVAIEFAVIPLIFSCYITAIVFSIINYVLIRRRIRIEEEALNIR